MVSLIRKHLNSAALAAINASLMLYATASGPGEHLFAWVLCGVFVAAHTGLIFVCRDYFEREIPWKQPFLSYAFLAVAFAVQGAYGTLVAEQGFFSFWGLNLMVGIWALSYIFLIAFKNVVNDMTGNRQGEEP